MTNYPGKYVCFNRDPSTGLCFWESLCQSNERHGCDMVRLCKVPFSSMKSTKSGVPQPPHNIVTYCNRFLLARSLCWGWLLLRSSRISAENTMCLASPCFNDWFKRTPSCCKVNCDFKGVKNRMFFFQFRSPKNAFYWPFHFKSFEFARSLLCLSTSLQRVGICFHVYRILKP